MALFAVVILIGAILSSIGGITVLIGKLFIPRDKFIGRR